MCLRRIVTVFPDVVEDAEVAIDPATKNVYVASERAIRVVNNMENVMTLVDRQTDDIKIGKIALLSVKG